MTKDQITAEIAATREHLLKLEEELKKSESATKPFFDPSKDVLTISQVKNYDWSDTSSAVSVMGHEYVSLRIEGEYAGKGFFLKGDWQIVTDSEGEKVLTLQKYISENQPPETFEKFGRVWKRHDGSVEPPEEAIKAGKVYTVNSSEMSGLVEYTDYPNWASPISNWSLVVGYQIAKD